jgi:hypothetical protein
MGTQHQVAQGESVESIAYEAGLLAETVWNDPANADLKKTRTSLHVLFPGDSLYVPDIQTKVVPCATGQKYTFKRKGIPSRLKVRFLVENKPRAGAAYQLVIDGGDPIQGSTTGAGDVDQPIDPLAQSATLHFVDDPDEVVYSLQLRYLNPIDTVSGARERLRNLGYEAGPPGDDPDSFLAAALAEFQQAQGLPATGALDDATGSKLQGAHAC